ncbi:carboxypeptidase-like regulatory domain-containing protein [Tenacibaculum jejuense]|uniref:Probable lipoprotein n=1 Tax=Tenacibaculum jejuense TaxID=584609 RepID=A0A238UAV0_9FLAO|nr:carboxypeptidase-like regulatory domain-containing protein [Tenacibaculum jejuense]SNR16299.1 Probable lipoprotein precursor [Tenacibaculum jejuense]
MKRNKSFFIVLSLSIFIFTRCISFNNDNQPRIEGDIIDEAGNPITHVELFYRDSLISTKTDANGHYQFNTSRTLFLKFKKEGYHTRSAKIENFSENEQYHFRDVVLKKKGTNTIEYEKISLNKKHENVPAEFSGKVENLFSNPLQNVTVTLTDSLKKEKIVSSHFRFKKYRTNFILEKEGYDTVDVSIPYYKSKDHNITLINKDQKKQGIYLVKSNELIPLPQAKLLYTTEKKIGRILWGGNFGYNIRKFFYPKKIKEFKIEKDSLIRFIVFDPVFASYLYKAKENDNYLGTADYKYSASPISKGYVDTEVVYPNKESFYYRGKNKARVIEFTPDSTGNYVFINSQTKKGYYFSY